MDLGLDYLSPTAPLGFAILLLGAFFTAGVFYILLNLDKDSESDKKRKAELISEQAKKISKLYPKKDSE